VREGGLGAGVALGLPIGHMNDTSLVWYLDADWNWH
jgi:hypothetical protein